jgi:glycosyltransferase involved in cell wall biosynthesis
MIPYIEHLEHIKFPYVVTLHGLVSFNDEIDAYSLDKKLEKDFINNYIIERKTLVTTISSGMKIRIESGKNISNLRVILNSTDLVSTIHRIDIHERYGLSRNCKIVLSIGNLTKRKNQTQILKAINIMDDTIKKNVRFLFLGEDSTNGEFDTIVNSLSLDKYIVKCGFITPAEIESYWNVAFLNVLASIDEGFGLSIIEGFSRGVPSIVFNDIDAFHDLYNEDSMIGVDRRTDLDLSNAIVGALERDWDKKLIIQHSRKFNTISMSDAYLETFREASSNEKK